MKFLTERQQQQLETLLNKYIGAFGLRQSIARMSNLTPIKVELVANHPEIKAGEVTQFGNREKIEFLQRKFEDLERAGICKPAKNPIYSCIAFAVPKKQPGQFRMVGDFRKLNKYSKRTALQMPNLEQQLTFIHGSRIYAGLDILSGFDFMPVHESSQQFFNVVTPTSA